MNETEKLIEEQLKTLPLAIQRAIKATPWKQIVQEIGRENALDLEQIASLEQETMLVLYAFEDPNDLLINISREVGVDEVRANIIAESVAKKVFLGIQEKSEEKTEPQLIPQTITKPIETPMQAPSPVKPKVPEIAPGILPKVVPEEKAHDTTPEERAWMKMGGGPELAKKIQVPPDIEKLKKESIKPPTPSAYQSGQDPYREPIG
jgi:hypothetical protein